MDLNGKSTAYENNGGINFGHIVSDICEKARYFWLKS